MQLMKGIFFSSVRKISYFLDEVEKSGHGDGRGKTQLYDKLGDLCCALKAYPAAVKFYGRQVGICKGSILGSPHRNNYMLFPLLGACNSK